MKTAIYIEDGVVQLVLTPESRHEKNCMELMKDKKATVKLFDGSFYDCRGGWIRQSQHFPHAHDSEPQSIIIMIEDERKEL